MSLNWCSVVRPTVVVITIIAMLSIIAPGLFASIWPYLAAAAVLAALTSALLEWSRDDAGAIRDAVDRALGVLEGSRG